jgi:LemA protein
VLTEWIILGIAAAIPIYFMIVYNKLINLRNMAQNAWSQIDVQLKRRHDLIPNIVELVKDTMGYEQETLKQVVEARNRAVSGVG